MQTILVQLTNQNALQLLQDLEKLHIIRLLRKSITPDEKLSDKFAGKLPIDVAEKIRKGIEQNRGEWDKNNS
jgi:hypothetical protein